jgi:hypothetical protein
LLRAVAHFSVAKAWIVGFVDGLQMRRQRERDRIASFHHGDPLMAAKTKGMVLPNPFC